MFNNRSFYLLMVITILVVTACAPQVASTPISSTATPLPTAEEPPVLEPTLTPAASTAAEVSPLEFKGHERDVWGVDISPDGKYLATGSADQTAMLWDLASGQSIRTFSGHTSDVGRIVFSPDSKYILTGSGDGTARLWDVTSGETVQVFSGSTDALDVGGFSSDGKYIITAGFGENNARLWEVATGKTVHVFEGHSDYVPAAAISPDGQYVLTGSVDRTARLWDASTGSEVRDFSGHNDGIVSVAFSSDGKYIATGSDDQIARVWDVATGQLLREFTGHEGFINGIKFSPDGGYLLTGSADTTARLWDVATGETIHIFKGHRADVQTVTFSADGSLVATASNDGIARVWDLQASIAAMPAQDESGTTTLRLAVADGGGAPSEPYVLAFIEQVKTLSNGNIIVEPIWEAGNRTEAGFETGVIQLVRTGEVELGLAASRAFDNESITSFQALQAPFLIDNDSLVKALATSDISTQMLKNLTSAGLTGLTIWPEDLRHPFSLIPDKHLLSPEDFAGLNIRTTPSGVSNMLVEALGGKPTFEDNYGGAESGLRQGASLNGNATATGNVTFFAKYQVLFANGTAFEKLSEKERVIVREAAKATQSKALAEHPSELEAAAAWCSDGRSIVLASDEQVAAFETAVQPVFDAIEQDPRNAELISAIRELKANTAPSPGAEGCGP